MGFFSSLLNKLRGVSDDGYPNSQPDTVPDEPVNEPTECRYCGKPLQTLSGRFGPYKRCTDTENCKFTWSAKFNDENRHLRAKK
jgi:hypothetical protein